MHVSQCIHGIHACIYPCRHCVLCVKRSHMYVCMYVCTYVCVHVCMYVCMYVCVHVCMDVRMYVITYLHIHICTYAIKYTGLLTYIHIYIYTWGYVCIYTQTEGERHTHTTCASTSYCSCSKSLAITELGQILGRDGRVTTHPRLIHGLHLLKEQFASIWQTNVGHPLCAAAELAPVRSAKEATLS